MDWLALLLKLSHVLLAIAMVAGLLGRWILLTRAAASDDVERAHLLAEAASPFERIVQVVSPLVIVVGLVTAWAQGYEWLGLTTGWMLLTVLLIVPIMLFIPISWFDVVYRWVFPKDDLPASLLKNSMVLWWLVASGSAWARYLTVATGQLSASTFGNLIVFACTFLLGPLLVWFAGFNPVYIVPATLAALNLYWFWYLYGLRRLDVSMAASA